MERNYKLDIIKYIMSLFIIAIHSAFLSDVNGNAYFFIVHILCRSAVPFFAISTGYLLMAKASKSEGSQWIIFKRYWKRILRLYLIWTIIYLFYSIPHWIQIDWFSLNTFIDYAISFFKGGSHYHFWYLLDILYALPFFYLIVVFIKDMWYIPLAIALYLIKAITYGYIMWMPASLVQVWNRVYSFGGNFFDAFFCILPFFLIGAALFKTKKTLSIKPVTCLLAISFVCLIIEASILKQLGQTQYSYIIFTFSTAYWFFYLILYCLDNTIRSNMIKSLGMASTVIYCIHPIFLESLKFVVHCTIPLFIVTSVISTFVSLCLVRVNTARRLLS